MNADFVALLRPVVAWARANGWQPDVYLGHYRGPGYRLVIDSDGWISVNTFTDAHFTRSLGRFWAASPRHAIDVLCALGVLPVEFASGYRLGQSKGVRCGLEVAWLAYHDDKRAAAA